MCNINFNKFKIIIYVLILIFLNKNSWSYQNNVEINDLENFCGEHSKKFLNNNIEQIETLEINFNNNRAWIKNAIRVRTSGSNNILEKFKKRFNGIIIINYKNNITCTYKAAIRQHGDKMDHINYKDGQFRQSLDVELKEGNIFGITEFKLINPESRNRKNEIIFINILRKVGLLAPRSFYVKAKVIDKQVDYIFQEKIVKEFIENNNFREGPLIEGDERFMWVHSESEDYNKKYITLTKLRNNKWSKKNIENFYMSLDGLAYLNLLYFNHFENINFKNIKFSNIKISKDINENSNNVFEALMMAANGFHGLAHHNRVFYLNPITYEIHPIYYDGEIEFKKRDYIDNVSLNSIKGSRNTINLLKSIDIQSIKKNLNDNFNNFSSKDVSKTINILISNLEQIENAKKRNVQKINSKNIFLDFDKKEYREVNFVFFNSEKNNFYVCDINAKNCKEKRNKKINREEIFKHPNVFAGFMDENFNISYNPQRHTWKKKINYEEGIKIFLDENIRIEFIKDGIVFYQLKPGAKVLIKDGDLRNKNIVFKGYFEKGVELKNLDLNRTITGCVTFYDLNIEDVTFKSDNSTCEDALNIVNSRGKINKVEIVNSISDGLDVDFSKIRFDKIIVKNSKNDCADFSYGEYLVNIITTINCDDKGVSVGEKSKMFVNNFEGKSSNIGLAIKDSSEGIVDNINLDEQVKLCVALYRKKQEFHGSILKYKNLNCPSNQNYISNVSSKTIVN